MDYKKSEIVGSKWHRFSTINISNPRVGTPSVICTEQEVFTLADTEVIRDVGSISFTFDPNTVFDVLNPLTGEAIGTGTGAQVYALVYSYVMHEAKLRDDAAAAALILPPPVISSGPLPVDPVPPASDPQPDPNPLPP